jgi:AcrR family transcriptional regulator
LSATNTAGTQERILEATFRLLHQDGYARLSTRDIAGAAGVNHALIHYYFRTKDKLVMAALDEANRRLTERSRLMYSMPAGGFAGKWAEARRFYEEDFASGFVRVQMELLAASLSNLELREEFQPRFMKWREILTSAATDALAYYQLDLPISPRAIACWITDFWAGMEFEMLLGIGESEGHHQEALDAMKFVLELLDMRAQTRNTTADTSE